MRGDPLVLPAEPGHPVDSDHLTPIGQVLVDRPRPPRGIKRYRALRKARRSRSGAVHGAGGRAKQLSRYSSGSRCPYLLSGAGVPSTVTSATKTSHPSFGSRHPVLRTAGRVALGSVLGALLGLLLLLLLMILDESLADRRTLESGELVRVNGSWLVLLVFQLVPLGAVAGAAVGWLVAASRLAAGAVVAALLCVLAWEVLGYWF